MRSKNLTMKLAVTIFVLILLIAAAFIRLLTLPKTPNFVGMEKHEAILWATRKNYEGLSFEYIDNEEYQKDVVIDQSIKAGDYLQNKITLKLSNGPKQEEFIKIPTLKTKAEIEKWAKENNVQYEFKYEDNELEKDSLIRYNPQNNITKTTKMTFILSSGPVDKEVEVEKDSDVIYIGYDYVNESESYFISKMNQLGLKAKEIDPYYSFDVEKGNVYTYTKGNFKKGETVEYALSRGPYSFSEGDWKGLYEDDAWEQEENLNNRNARISLSIDEDYSSSAKGKIFSCSSETYDYIHYVECLVSLGPKSDPEPTPQPTPQPEPTPQPSPEPEPTPEPPKEETAVIPAMNVFESMMFSSAEEAESSLRSGVFAKFTNVNYIKQKTRDYLVGSVYQVEVNGDASYNSGEYPISTSITVYISQGY